MNTISSLPEWLVYSLLFIGAFTVGSVVFCSIIEIIDNIKAKISVRAYAYNVKHRFDKPPLAKCYCRDCEYWAKPDNDTAHCSIINRYTGDNCFCYYATPRKKDPDSQ